MHKFSINYNELSDSICHSRKEIFRLSDVKHRLEKVAFDVFRFKDSNSDELWQIQNSDDGDYIVARYESDEPKIEVVASNKWEVLVSESSNDINVFYKGMPITKITGTATEDLNTVKRFLPSKLATNKGFVSALLNTLDESSKDAILKLYPELL